jgi:uncharacterized protein Smg (DUF494 family)
MAILGGLKSVVREFYDPVTGVVMSVGKSGRTLDGKRYHIIKNLLELVFKTDFCNEPTRVCILDYSLRPSDVYKELYLKTGIKMDKRTCINKVAYCEKKMEKLLGENIVVDVVDFTTRDIDTYYDKVNMLLSKYKNDTAFDIYDLDIGNVLPSSKEVSLERMEAVCNKLKPYLRVEKSKILDNLDIEALGYIKYLYGLDETVDDRKLMVKAIIGVDL